MPSGIPDEIKLKTGESFTINLKGLSTAGYVWNYTIDDEKDCIKVSKEFAPQGKPAQRKTGASVDEVFTITGKKSGIAYIHFSQHRSWEKNIPALNEKKVKISIE